MTVRDNDNRTTEVDGGDQRERVLFVSHSAGLYGAERSLLTLVRGLVDTGRVEPLVVLPISGPLSEALTSNEVPTLIARSAWWAGTPSLPRRLGLGARGH